MKNSKAFFLAGAAILFFWVIGGFSPWISWESRLVKIVLVALLAGIAWWMKNSKKATVRKSALVVTLLLALGTAYAEPYASHLMFGHHHHHFFCGK